MGETAPLIKGSLEYLQLYAGVGTPILKAETDIPVTARAEQGWLTSVKKYLSSCDAEILLTQQWCPELQRTGDSFLMEALQQKFSGQLKKLKTLNRCRLYLRVLTLADISTSSGDKLCPAML